MTTAACYVSPEGVVFGADSTSTILIENPASPGDPGERARATRDCG